MLTPQEVAQRSFGKASFGGYNMAMVDDFLDELTADYEALFNENALLKQKLGVLSGKIREYQSTCLLYTYPSPRDAHEYRMPSSS